MTVTPNFVPREYKLLNIELVVTDAQKAIQFYNSAFGADLITKLVDPSGLMVFAELRIEDTILMLSENKNIAPSNNCALHLYTGDVEGVFENALKSGAKLISSIEKQYYGDRAGRIEDPFGFHWVIATHMEDVSSRELYKRFNDLYS